jgi:ferredoxin
LNLFFESLNQFTKRIVNYLLYLQKKTIMAIMITDECINCGACEPECPNNAIYEGGAEWKYSDGTSLKGMITTLNGEEIDASNDFEPKDMDVYYIVTDKCTECVGFHDEPQCAAVCPVDCCVDDPEYRESEDELLAKKDFMHL